ncbi:uncharacterized protein A4U43_C09F11130 [Asparagus officinalis]|uniref:Uncharacterized protein n=1 Tax=Asparagus officinalis TaxID=4686 RepID=A0A5P1E8K4_ASPOF|nr:uncharacterized protein A4U43_C09F11130 [Asparagus officinalis]
MPSTDDTNLHPNFPSLSYPPHIFIRFPECPCRPTTAPSPYLTSLNAPGLFPNWPRTSPCSSKLPLLLLPTSVARLRPNDLRQGPLPPLPLLRRRGQVLRASISPNAVSLFTAHQDGKIRVCLVHNLPNFGLGLVRLPTLSDRSAAFLCRRTTSPSAAPETASG